MKPLKRIHPAKATQAVSVDSKFFIEKGALCVDFNVKSPFLFVNSKLGLTESQHGLWDWDVVEVFVTADNASYCEFQVSPLNQFFELKILEPRKRFEAGFRSGFTHTAKIQKGNGWSAEFRIPLSLFGKNVQPEQLVGNAFACLGEGELRQYFSLFLPEQEKPDFHLPQYFQKLF